MGKLLNWLMTILGLRRNHFVLAWYDEDNLVGEVELANTSEDDVRAAFNLEPGEYPGDCLDVTVSQVDFVRQRTGVVPDLHNYKYFVEFEQKEFLK